MQKQLNGHDGKRGDWRTEGVAVTSQARATADSAVKLWNRQIGNGCEYFIISMLQDFLFGCSQERTEVKVLMNSLKVHVRTIVHCTNVQIQNNIETLSHKIQ